MKKVNLSNQPYHTICRLIDQATIEMYQDITDALLHDTSPLELSCQVIDIWVEIAKTLHYNDNITHQEYLSIIMRISELVEVCLKSLGVEYHLN
jgi:hypothetical protein